MTVPGIRPHRAVEFINDLGDGVLRRECQKCGLPIVGFIENGTLRHVGEEAPVEHPDPKYAETVNRACLVLTRAMNVDDAQARTGVLALYRDGLLRQRRATPQES